MGISYDVEITRMIIESRYKGLWDETWDVKKGGRAEGGPIRPTSNGRDKVPAGNDMFKKVCTVAHSNTDCDSDGDGVYIDTCVVGALCTGTDCGCEPAYK